MFFDSHCHLTADAFSDDLEAVLEAAHEAGVAGMVCIASTPEDADAAIRIAEAHSDVWATAGVHPHEAGSVDSGWDDAVEERLGHPRVVAVGECGLDFHYDFVPRDRQFEVFGRQIELAESHDLPLVVHSRSANAETLEFLRGMPSTIRGVLHCFGGSRELLETALSMGWYVSFAGMVTFRNFDAAELLRTVPLTRLLVETDSPYLAPVPFRGKRNQPAYVGRTAERVAELLGVDPQDLAEQTTMNARTFYRLNEG